MVYGTIDRAINKKNSPIDLKGKRVLVVGLGASGRSAARFLASRGAAVTVTDEKPSSAISERAASLEALGVEVEAGGHKRESFLDADFVIVSPGVPGGHPLLEAARGGGACVIGEIELASRFIDAPVIAVTGTNGKSTVTTLIGRFFEEAGKKVFVGGNLGTPAVECAGKKVDACVLEVSSFQLETIDRFRPHVGVLLNVTEDHLDRYLSYEDYGVTKLKLFKNQERGDWAVINAGDPFVREKLEEGYCGSGRVVAFTTAGKLKEGVFLEDGDIVFSYEGRKEVYPTEEVLLKGLHNMENVMASIASARLSGIPAEVIRRTLKTFRGLPHRMEFVRELNGVTYIDDSKGTNIGALLMALKGARRPVVLLAGGRDKGGDYSVLKELVSEKVRLLILLGEARFQIKEALGAYAETKVVSSMEEAVLEAHRRATPGDTVLLCPACSSFDMFRSYAERGERFRRLVEALS